MKNQDRLVCSSTIDSEQSGEAMIIFIIMMERERADSTGACQQYNRAVHSPVKAALDVNVAAASGPNSDFLMKRINATKNYSSGGLKRSQIDRIRNVGL